MVSMVSAEEGFHFESQPQTSRTKFSQEPLTVFRVGHFGMKLHAKHPAGSGSHHRSDDAILGGAQDGEAAAAAPPLNRRDSPRPGSNPGWPARMPSDEPPQA